MHDDLTFIALSDRPDSSEDGLAAIARSMAEAYEGRFVIRASTIEPMQGSRLSEELGGGVPMFAGREPGVALRIRYTGTAVPTASALVSLLDLVAGWRTEEHPVYDLGAGESSEFRARLGLVTRRPDLTTAEYEGHYESTHIPLVVANDPLFNRYVVDFVRESTTGNWGSIVEQRFPDYDTWLEHDRRIFEERPEVRADIPTFMAGIDQFVATFERQITVGATPA